MNSTPQPMNLYLDSNSALNHSVSGDFNDLTFKFRPVDCKSGYSFKISLLSLTIANTQQTINLYNNQLIIGTQVEYFEPGNYSASTLAELLQLAFPDISVQFNEITTKFYFKSASPITIAGTMCQVLDIEELTTGTTISTKKNVDLSGVSYIDVETNLVSESSIDASGEPKRGLLCRVQNNTDSLGILHFSDPNLRQGTTISDRVLYAIRIRLTGDRGLPVLASLPWVGIIRVEQVPSGVQDLHIYRPGNLTENMGLNSLV